MRFGGQRFVRFAVAMALAGFISAQIPIRGITAFAQTRQDYQGGSGGEQNNFLGINGLSNRDAIQGAVLLLVGYGIYATIRDSKAGAGVGEVLTPGPESGVVPIGNKSIYEVAKDSPDFQSLAQGMDNAEMQKTYKEDGPFTVFGPNEAAFAKLPADSPLKPLFALTAGGSALSTELKEALKSQLSYHTVKGRYTIDDLKKLPEGTNLRTLSDTIVVITNADGLKINGIPVIENDIPASNGLIHPIETILTPGDTGTAAAPVAPAAP
ncbi:MAG: fasciclin domain-containing protein [Armatimonadota bacterium]